MTRGKRVHALVVVAAITCLAAGAYAGELEARSNPVANGGIVIDGNLGDWAGVTPFTPDPAGDAAAGDQDWAQAWVAHDDNFIYLRLDRTASSVAFDSAAIGTTSGGGGYWTLMDTDGNAQTGLNLAGVRPFSIGAEFNLNGVAGVSRWGAGGASCGLGSFAPEAVSALAATNVEMVIARSKLGNPAEFDIQMLGENSGDYYPDDTTKVFHYSTITALGEPLPANIAASRSNPVANGTISMDGSMADWASVTPFPDDPAGDVASGQDWVRVFIAHDDNNFYVRIERAPGSTGINSPGYWGFIDTDRSVSTGLTAVGTYSLALGAEYNFGGVAAINLWNSNGSYSGTTFGWDGAGQAGPTSVEIAIRRTNIGDPASFNLLFAGDTSGDYYPDGGAGADYFHYTVHEPGPTGAQPTVTETRSNRVANGSITLKGLASEWAAVTPFSADPAGDGGTNQDWVQAWIAHDDSNVYFRIERASNSAAFSGTGLNRGYWTIMDTDSNLATGFTGFGARDFPIGGEFNISGTTAVNQWGSTGCFAQEVPFASFVPAATEAEVAIARSTLGNPVDFNIIFVGENSGDYYPDGANTTEYFHYTTTTPPSPLPGGMLQSLSNPVANGAIVADGNLSDWTGVTPFMADAAGDGGASQDWVQVWIAHDSTNFYLRFKRADGALPLSNWGYWAFIDTDKSLATGLKAAGERTFSVGAEFNTGGITAFNKWDAGGAYAGPASFARVGEAASTTCELSVARADLGHPTRFRVVFVGENSGDYYPDGTILNQTFLYALKPCNIPFADTDGDGDVDLVDFGAFQRCYTGSGFIVSSGCECFDRDYNGQGDTDVDAADFEAFRNCWSGPMIPLNPACE